MTRGYQLDASAKEANARANQSSVELERATTRANRQPGAHRGTAHPGRGRLRPNWNRHGYTCRD